MWLVTGKMPLGNKKGGRSLVGCGETAGLVRGHLGPLHSSVLPAERGELVRSVPQGGLLCVIRGASQEPISQMK